MSGHHAANSGRDRGTEGNQFQRIQPRAIGANHRQVNVRIRRGVAVTGEMFCRGQAAVFLHAAHVCRNKF